MCDHMIQVVFDEDSSLKDGFIRDDQRTLVGETDKVIYVHDLCNRLHTVAANKVEVIK